MLNEYLLTRKVTTSTIKHFVLLNNSTTTQIHLLLVVDYAEYALYKSLDPHTDLNKRRAFFSREATKKSRKLERFLFSCGYEQTVVYEAHGTKTLGELGLCILTACSGLRWLKLNCPFVFILGKPVKIRFPRTFLE